MLLLLALTALAEPPLRDAPGDVMPPRHWDLQHLDLELRVEPDAGRVDGTATWTATPLGAADGWFRLNQVGLDVAWVEVDGERVSGWRLGRETLDVPVAPAPGERTVRVRWRASPQDGMHFVPSRDGVVVWTQGEREDNRHWLPSWDYPSDRFTYAATLDVPAGLVAQTNGELVELTRVGDRERFRYELRHELLTYLIAVVVGDLRVEREVVGGVSAEYVGPRHLEPGRLRATLSPAEAQLPWLGEQLGTPYPYGVYRQVVVPDFLYSGMENTAMTLIGDHRLVPVGADAHAPTESIVAHELAHQWFGDLLSCYGWQDLWLNEGFATFWAREWMAHAHGEDAGAVGRKRASASALRTTTPLAPRGWSRTPDARPWSGGVYTKGSMVLELLRQTLGEEAFMAGMRAYVADNRDRMVETDDLRRAMEDASGQHLGWLFDAWVHGTGAPELSSRHRWADGELTVEITQATEGWTVPVMVEVGTSSGPVTRRVWAGEGTTRLVLPMPAPPWYVSTDPRRATLATWEREQAPEEWLAQLDSPHADTWLQAVDALAEVPATEAVVDALTRELHDPERLGVARAEVARALGELGQAEPLRSALSDTDADVREGAAEAIAGLARGPELARAVGAALDREGDPWVRAELLGALAQHDPDQAVRVARRSLRPAGVPGEPEAAAAAAVLGEHGGGGAGRLLAGALDGPRPIALASMEALVRLATRGEVDGDAVHRAVLPLLGSPEIRRRTTAIRTLGRAGTDDSADALRQWMATRTGHAERQEARQAIARLEARADEPATDERQSLEPRLQELEERVDALEIWR